jgi:uncharacterized repeat protein (TIGR01451 family)
MSTHAASPFRAFPVLIAVIFNLVAGPLAPIIGSPAAAAPVTLVDEQGANDEPGQKDLTQLTVDYGVTGSVPITFNWDELGTSGANTLNGCALFDTDGDFKANYALCVVTGNNPAVQVSDSPRLYTCTDGRVDRCTGQVLVATPYASSCTTTSPSATDPFPTGASYPNDTRASCTVALSDVGGGSALLLNVCSYPSEIPHSDPSDCVLVPRDGFINVTKVATPDDKSVTFQFTLDNSAAGSTSGSGSFVIAVTSGVAHNLAESPVPTGWTLSSATCSNGNAPSAVTVASDATVTCTFNNSRQTGKLEVVKDLNPASDPGKFNLQIDGSTAGGATNVGDNGTTGEITLNTGSHSFGETAGTGTDLANYTTSASCVDQANNNAAVTVTSGSVNVTSGSDILCTITNSRQTGKLEVVKDLNPASDPGKFNLQIDGSTAGGATNVGDGGTTGSQTLNTGSHTVGETAGTGTALTNYASSIRCVDGETEVAQGAGAGPLSVNVTEGSSIVCTISNTRVEVSITKVNDQGENPTVEPGDTVHYTLTVTVNTGTATGVVVTDTLPAGLTYVEESALPSTGFSISADGRHLQWTVGSLNGPGSFTYEYDATVDANASGSLKNLGCVDADQNDLLVCNETTVVVQRISIEKTNGTTGSVLPGTVVDFTLTLSVENGPVEGITIVDQLPTGISAATNISGGGSYDSATNQITWSDLSEVTDGDTLTYSATVSATATAGSYTNTATITEGPCVGDDCTGDSTVTVRVPTLVIDKAASVDLITISGPANAQTASPSSVTWTLTYTLTSGPVTNAVITDTIPTGLVFVAGSAGTGVYDPATRTVTWTFEQLNASGSVSFRTTIDVATISRTAPTENVAVIRSDQSPSDEGRDSVRVTVIPPPLAGNPTPTPRVPNTAVAFGPGGQPITVPIELLVVLFLGSLGGLAFANLRAVQRRRR